MTPQEIITEIKKLPPSDWGTIKSGIKDEADQNNKRLMTEQEFLQSLYAKGIIGNIADLSQIDDEDDFEPIDVLGEPLSQMIIRERR